MRTLVNPRQTRLFDPFDSVLTPQARRRLLNDWPGVFHAIYLKVAGWNMRRAAACAKMRDIVYERANRSVLGAVVAILRPRIAISRVYIKAKTQIRAYVRQLGANPPLPNAA